MKYRDISGYIAALMCIFQFQSYGSQVASFAQEAVDSSQQNIAQLQNKPQDVLFKRYGLDPLARDIIPRDVQYMVVNNLIELLVGKIEFGKPFRTYMPNPMKMLLDEAAFRVGKSVVNYFFPGFFELPPDHYHFRGLMTNLIFTDDDEHIVGSTVLMHFVVALNAKGASDDAQARLVEFVDLQEQPRSVYEKTDERFFYVNTWEKVFYEYDEDYSCIKPIKLTGGMPLVLYEEICKRQERPFWEKRGDLELLLKEYPISAFRHTEGHELYITVGQQEISCVSPESDLINQYRLLDSMGKSPSNELVKFVVPEEVAMIRHARTFFCEFLPFPSRDDPAYKKISLYRLNKVGKEYESSISVNNRFLLLKLKEHKIPDLGEIVTDEVVDRLRDKVTNYFHVWDLKEGTCIQKFQIKCNIHYATICPMGRFALILCWDYVGENAFHNIVLLYHIPSGLVVGYQKRGVVKAAFNNRGNLFIVSYYDANPSIFNNSLNVWKLDHFIDLDNLFKGRILIEQALFILYLRELHAKGKTLATAIPELANEENVDEAELRQYFKKLYYQDLPKPIRHYLIKLMGT